MQRINLRIRSKNSNHLPPMKKLSVIFPLLLFAVCSCDQLIDVPAPQPDPQNGWVDFADPQNGQKTMYLNYTSTCEALDGDFEFVGDTLILEVLKSNKATVLMEYFTPGSISENRDTIYHEIESHGSFALLPERTKSSLFYFYGNDTLRLQPDNHQKVKQDGCRLTIGGKNFEENEIGYLESVTIGDITIEDKTVVSCIPMIMFIDGYLAYDANHLYMMHTASASEFNGQEDSFVTGWVAMEALNK